MNTKNFLSKAMRKRIALIALSSVVTSSGLIETAIPVNAAVVNQSSIVSSTSSTVLAPKGYIDTLISGATLSGTKTISGWFLDGNGVSKVEVLVDGTVVGTAVYGSSRNDVAAAFPAYKTSNCGYTYNLDTTKLTNGSHTIVIRETGSSNVQTSLTGVTVTVSNVATGSDFIFSNGTITGYTGTGGNVVIPSSIGGVSVTSIGDNAFNECSSLTSITIPNSVTSIGNYVFQSCSSLSAAYFEGNAPVLGVQVFNSAKSGFIVYYNFGATGFSNPWNGYPTKIYGSN